MRWKAFGITAAALVAVAALASAALADNPPPSSISPTTTTTTPSGGNGPIRASIVAFAGSVASASSSSLTVDVLWQRRGTTGSLQETVALDSSTKIAYGKGKSSIDPGDLVGVVATGQNGSLTARRVRVTCNCHIVAGTVSSASSSSVQVAVTRTGPFDTVLKGTTVTIGLNGSTQYAGGSSTLTSGEKIAVIFSASGFFKDPSFDPSTATFTALGVRTPKAAATP